MLSEVHDFLAAWRPFYLATIDAGVPRVRPLGLVMLHEGKIWLGMGEHKNVYKQIQANPAVEIAATDKDGRWIRITGRLVFDKRPELFDKALEVMPHLKEIYPNGGMGVGSLEDATAVINEPGGQTVKTIKL